ncbi:MAG: hydroxyacylglutathione hydrolase [Gammaproteobacteria bacterium]|nr:MAG: hydroxyacylglutathione hydrolase [Gammaproteobacteria bacterium]
MSNPRIHPVPALTDNYIWAYRIADTSTDVLLVDPGEAESIMNYCSDHGLVPRAILVTHNHLDHVGGIMEIQNHVQIPVYGPARTARFCSHFISLEDTQDFMIEGCRIRVIRVPGHTLDHLAYHIEKDQILFCGDTLFSSGCGYLFEGTYEQMYASLKRLASLPDETLCCCTHEYTLANLDFALTVEPDNPHLHEKLALSRALRSNQKPTLPTTLANEHLTNPFLRCHIPEVRRAAERHEGRSLDHPVEVFASLRKWKNRF